MEEEEFEDEVEFEGRWLSRLEPEFSRWDDDEFILLKDDGGLGMY